MIVGSDLNLTLNSREYWGEVARSDPLVEFSTHFFEDLRLVDVEPIKVVPTWRNSRSGWASVSKRLD
jgi:hypothetical protein